MKLQEIAIHLISN